MWWVILILALVILAYFYSFKSTERLVSNDKIILFYADWCPACQKIKPAWDQVKARLSNHVFEEINISDQALTDAKEKEYGVKVPSVPTIFIWKHGQAELYKGPKTLAGFTQAFV